jgi:hypothetical protein
MRVAGRGFYDKSFAARRLRNFVMELEQKSTTAELLQRIIHLQDSL